jgi:putative PEP-CTERM system histidine kinase
MDMFSHVFTSGVLVMLAAAFALLLALAVALKARRMVSHWSFVAGMLALAAESFFAWHCLRAETPQSLISWENCRLFAGALLPGCWLMFSLTYARGNSGEFLSRWRYLLIAIFLLPTGIATIFAGNLVADAVKGQSGVVLTTAGVAVKFFTMVGMVLVLMNLERTFRTSVGTMRWRIKFMIMGLGILFLTHAYTSSQALLFYRLENSLAILESGALFLACPLIARALMRTGHFEVNLYPSHSIVHNSVILALAGVYLLVVGVFANVVRILGADASFTLKAFILLLGLVLLTVLMMSDRVRLQTKRFVSRHFQSPLYDYRTVWRRFTECAASRMDQNELCRATVGLVADVFQALSVTIWLVDEKKSNLVFAASTSLSDAQVAELHPTAGESQAVLQELRLRPDPVEIESSKHTWASGLRRCHPDQFHKGGSRICVPMAVGGEVLGVMILGDRVAGIPFMHQDLDLLKCLGDQLAANVRYLQLSGKLMQVKEMEAFQAMSTFFVHDLKNTASTLGLMLKNLPVHFNDPAFREDALRGVSKTVTHINSLITRLSTLRQGLEMNRAESDLNVVVEKCLASHKGALDVAIEKELSPTPKIFMDGDQVSKVITNLVLNAAEAVPKTGGKIRIQTAPANGWAMLSVEDNGCGMSPEFLNRSLFRPFQTTKKSGLGIGMFQSKMIIEAHGGRIEVESQQGKGSIFRVLLPINT